ncbi:hypothetical protein SLA2020_054980 [Shorea laevis]
MICTPHMGCHGTCNQIITFCSNLSIPKLMQGGLIDFDLGSQPNFIKRQNELLASILHSLVVELLWLPQYREIKTPILELMLMARSSLNHVL